MASIYKDTYKGFRSYTRNAQSHAVGKDELDAYRMIVSEEFLNQCIFPFEAALSNTLENALCKMTKMLMTGLFKDSKTKHEKGGKPDLNRAAGRSLQKQPGGLFLTRG